MSEFIVAQAAGEYVSLSAIVDSARSTLTLLISRAQNVEFTTWLIVAGVGLVLAVLWGLRPPH